MYDFIVTTMSYILQLESLPVETQTQVLDGLQEYVHDRRVELKAQSDEFDKQASADAVSNDA